MINLSITSSPLSSDPDPDMSYEITYNVYAGRGKGDYAMSFYYNAEEDKYEWDELTPVLK